MGETKKLNLAQKVGIGIATLSSAVGLNSRVAAETFNPTDSISYINQTIQNSSDSSHTFNSGTYNFTTGEYLGLKPSTDYIFDNSGVIFTSDISEDSKPYIEITQGGNISLSGNLSLENRMNGILIGATEIPYQNISISDIKLKNSQYGIILKNIEHATPTNSGSVDITNCLFEGGKKAIFFDYMGKDATDNAPYASVINSTLSGQSSSSGAIDLPQFWNGSEYEIKGNNEILNNAFINCVAITEPSSYSLFHSPSMNGYLDVASPFLEDGTTRDSNGNEIVQLEDKIGDYQLQLTDGTIVGYQAIPEPSTIGLVAFGGAALSLTSNRKKNSKK